MVNKFQQSSVLAREFPTIYSVWIQYQHQYFLSPFLLAGSQCRKLGSVPEGLEVTGNSMISTNQHLVDLIMSRQFAVWSQLKESFHSKNQDTKLWKLLRSVLKFKQKFRCFIWGSSSCGPSTFAKEYLPPQVTKPPYMDTILAKKYQRILEVGSFLIQLCYLTSKKKSHPRALCLHFTLQEIKGTVLIPCTGKKSDI